ncbi:MAG: hypothetical protein WDW36_007179 [Sanguina aurantia]
MAQDRRVVETLVTESDVAVLRRTFNAPDSHQQQTIQASSSAVISRPRPALLQKSPITTPFTRQPLLDKANECACDSKGVSNPSKGWSLLPHHPSPAMLWARIRQEAQLDAVAEPALASHRHSTILSHATFEQSLAFILADKLSSPALPLPQLVTLIQEVYADEPDIVAASMADMLAVYDRDPACDTYTQLLLCFKGYQAVQAHRIAHWLWERGRTALGHALRSRSSQVFSVDIHPGAQFGRGILIDHGTGVVIGESCVLGDNVSMLHHVTLGGSGPVGGGVRHPTIGHGVLLGAGVVVLGPITVGAGTKVGAGSVVVSELPCYCVAVGVPARIIKRDSNSEPVHDMDQVDYILDYVI